MTSDEDQPHSRAFDAAGQRVLLLETARLSANQTIDGFLLVKGDFACGASCRFDRAVYVAGSCEIGKGSTLERIEVDGSLHLGPLVTVNRVADCNGPLEIRSGCRVLGLAYSRKAVRLGFQAWAKDIFAPKILTPSGIRPPRPRRQSGAAAAIELEAPGRRLDSRGLRRAGIDSSRLRALASGAWLHDGSLCLEQPLLAACDFVVDGSLSAFPGSLFEGRLDVKGSANLGAETVTRGSVTAGGDLDLGPRCVFQGNLIARQMMHLSQGVRGLAEGRPVIARATGEVVLEEDVAVRGRLSSGCRVVALAADISAAVPDRAAAAERK